METREATEYKVYCLCLADMHGGVDKSVVVAVFDTLHALKNYYESQLAGTPWTDEPSNDWAGQPRRWHKVFKKGSPLEWYNDASSLEPQSWHDVAFGGVVEDWIRSYPSQKNFSVPYNPL